ncbi:hypothetical protein, partial [Paramuribaculum intestinale]
MPKKIGSFFKLPIQLFYGVPYPELAFPNFRLDYLDLIDIEPGDSKKWNDRLTDDGRWEHNLY